MQKHFLITQLRSIVFAFSVHYIIGTSFIITDLMKMQCQNQQTCKIVDLQRTSIKLVIIAELDLENCFQVYQETDGAIGVKEKVVIEIDDKENEVVRNDKPTSRNKDGTVSRRRSRSDHKAVEKSRDKNTVSERKAKGIF